MVTGIADYSMRERQLMQVFLALNVALVGAIAGYALFSRDRQPKVVTTSFPKSSPVTGSRTASLSFNASPEATVATAAPPVALVAVTNSPSAPPTIVRELSRKPTPAAKSFSWQDVESDEYLAYMGNLRTCGCPEATVRQIVLGDIHELFAQKRLQIAKQNDPQWWRPESYYAMTTLPHLLQERARQLEEDERALIGKLLGEEVAQTQNTEAVFWTDVQLTGPVLGKLSPSKHQAVQTVCRQSLDRQQQAFWEQANAGQAQNPVATARLRDQTRTELRRELNDEEMEEFLLRYSYNASRLRDELRGFNPNPEEFRRVFRVTDPLDHAMQLDYGSAEAMSAKQRERWQRQRDTAIKEVLSPDRYLVFLLTKDPLYRQAQLYATQYGAPAQAVQPIYEMTKLVEGRRQEILNNKKMSPQEKSKALQVVNLEQHQRLQKIVREMRQNSAQAKGNPNTE